MHTPSDAVRQRSGIWDALWLGAGVIGALLMALLFGSLLSATAGLWSSLDPNSPMAGFGGFVWLGISVVQLLWIVPSAVLTLVFRRTRFAGLGLIIGALLIFLLQSACYGVLVLALA